MNNDLTYHIGTIVGQRGYLVKRHWSTSIQISFHKMSHKENKRSGTVKDV